MVTTRRSSFGVQDGDTLALRSKSISTSTETTPTRKRKEYAMGVRSSSRKKRKSYGLDGTSDAPAEAQHSESMPLEDGRPLDEPTLSLTGNRDTDFDIAQPEGEAGEAQVSPAWLGEDFVPLSTEASVRGANAEKEHDISNSVEHTVPPDYRPTTGLDLDAKNVTKTNDSETKTLTDLDILDVSQELHEAADQQPFTQSSSRNVQHKRFGSDEPERIEEETTATGPQDRDLAPGVASGTDDDHTSSDDDAPEVVGSKSVVKDSRPPVKAPKKAKRKLKPNNAAKEQSDIIDTERAAAGEDVFFVDPLPKKVSSKAPEPSLSPPSPPSIQSRSPASRQPSKKRKLFAESERRPKDVVKDGVTYRTISREEPAIFASRRHKASHLPPKSSANSWRLKKQVLGRKRVQHVWGGRPAFLRT